MSSNKKYFVTGGAGFIGSHLVNKIIDETESLITVYDNFDNGRLYAYGERINDPRLEIITGDVKDLGRLTNAMKSHDIVYHFASNAEINKAEEEPSIDFWNGTYLTHNTLEAMRINKIKKILFTSGSGVYGELSSKPVSEKYDQMIPISTYGSCKLASESLISAYCHMFNMEGIVVRFANVIGPHQTHGVAYDFIRRLAHDPTQLKILGDGNQSKPYIHIFDILSALALLEEKSRGYEVYNVGSTDFMTVKEIADQIVKRMNLKNVKYNFTGGARGWKADVPIYRLDTTKIRNVGWENKLNSFQAMDDSIVSMLKDLEAGNITPSIT